MKRFTIVMLLFCSMISSLSAQVSFSGTNDYGRLKNFVYDTATPNRVYATSLDKHIMVSDDNGVSWEILYTASEYAYLAPYLQQMKLTNNNTALSFIAYYGNGNSLNNITVLDLQTLTVIKQYSMPEAELYQNFGSYDIADENTVFILANGTTDKAYYTTNGGENWTKVFDAVDFEGVLVNQTVMDPNNPEKLFIVRNGGAGNVDGGLLVSENAGQTWSLKLDGLILQTLSINPSNSNDLYAGTGIVWAYLDQHQALYHSVDGGITWTTVSDITWSDGGMDNVPFIAYDPNNANHVVVLGDDQIAVTLDAGATWTTTQHEGANAGNAYFLGEGVAFNPSDTNEVFISNSHYGYKSVDGGVTLAKVENPFYEVMGNMEIINDGTDQHLMYGVQFGYADRNLTTQVETPIDVMPLNEFPMSGQIYQMRADGDIPGRTYAYVSSFMGNSLEVSDDYGLTRIPLMSSWDTQFTAADTNPVNHNIAWLATFNGESATLAKVDFSDVNNIQPEYINLPYSGDWIYGLHINSNNPDEVLVTVGNRLFKTADGGTSWTEITSGLQDLVLPNIALSLVQNPLNVSQFTMAASNGIYTSLDGGATWSRIYDQMINKVEHSTATDGQIVGIGYSIMDILPKVVYSNDGGATWTEKTSEDYYNTIFVSGAITFSENSADVYIGTLSLGLLKDHIDLSTLGNTKFQTVSNATVFPNPTTGIVNIKLANGATVKTAIIYNMTGQKLSESNRNTIDFSNLANGVYVLQIESPDGRSESKRIVKN
ncbi:MAG TPA: T9SS type A sorting domain-containing protein [Flavobacterium sp.]|nr:T9SS type A sorting domain-containing protein [Flavobacterium sp.]